MLDGGFAERIGDELARAVWAFVIVSMVVKVLDATMKSVVSGCTSFGMSAIWAPSMLETKCARGPS